MKNKWQACYVDEQVKYQMKMAEYEMASNKKSEPECPHKKVAAVESAPESCDDTMLMNL